MDFIGGHCTRQLTSRDIAVLADSNGRQALEVIMYKWFAVTLRRILVKHLLCCSIETPVANIRWIQILLDLVMLVRHYAIAF